MSRPHRTPHFVIFFSVSILTIVAGSMIFNYPVAITKAEKIEEETIIQAPYKEGKHVIVYLHEMKVELRDGEKTLKTLPMLSQGRPGSYYETIGGEYENDYKIPLHFSSIGQVYMPYSVHVFGQYFIHGVPYHPNGQKVSTAYSGGCVRLKDEDAKQVYDFVETGTPIIITRGTDTAFKETKQEDKTLVSQELTNLMVATISLEALTQDNYILDTDRRTQTTRKETLTRLVRDGDNTVAMLYAKSMGEEAFVKMMNKKAASLGLANTHFENVFSPVLTTYEDHKRFSAYIDTYKSYLRSVQSPISPSL